MRGHEAHASEPRDAVEGAEQRRKTRCLGTPVTAQIQPIRVHVLAKQRDLPHAIGCQGADLVHDRLELTASLRPADPRHDAVGAEVGAAGHDLYPCLLYTSDAADE